MDKNKVYSDARVKESVAKMPTSECQTLVNDLPVSRYVYKDFMCYGPDPIIGFMAEDVREVFPKAVGTSDMYFQVYENGQPVFDIDEFGEEVPRMFLIEDLLDITMTEATPVLWGCCQELTKQINALTERVAVLENK